MMNSSRFESTSISTMCSPALLVSLLVLCGGCTALPGRMMDYDPALINGERAFGEVVPASEAGSAELTAISPEMTRYLDSRIGDSKLSSSRFKRLLKALSEDGYFTSTYNANITFNASETFAKKSGNCLSYTAMFIAMARYEGMNARFQIVRVPPSWDADSGYLIRYTHINVLLTGMKMDRMGDNDFTVDFNAVHPDPDYSRKIVSDQYAESLFHANRSVTAVRAGDDRTGLAHLARAIELVPNNPDLWINLGAFYGKRDDFASAIDAYQVGLSIDPGNKGAISGLSRAYAGAGDMANAELYGNQVKRYREKNAYYHFALAQAEFERADYPQALAAINTAIGLKRSNGRFYFMKALTEQKLGDLDSARQSFRRAERYGHFRDLKLRYVNEFAGVNQAAPGS
jgi:Flp pilus assembly protein TadD